VQPKLRGWTSQAVGAENSIRGLSLATPAVFGEKYAPRPKTQRTVLVVTADVGVPQAPHPALTSSKLRVN
jgi:hypothetical protein